MSTNKLFFIFTFLALIIFTSFDDADFPALPRIRSVTEWRAWADTIKYHEPKWLKSKREYYTNGELKSMLYVEANGDTVNLRLYKLDNDSLLKKDIWYNKYLKKWMDGDTYYYNKGEKLPYMTKDKDKYKCYYTYDPQGRITGKRLVNDKDENFAEYEFTYDSAGLMIRQIEFDFFGGERDEKRCYIYEYNKNEKGEVIKKETFFVPDHTQESVTKQDKQGNQKTTYYGFTAKTKTLMETVYYNDRGERTKKIEYDRENNPQFIWTYNYEYYK